MCYDGARGVIMSPRPIEARGLPGGWVSENHRPRVQRIGACHPHGFGRPGWGGQDQTARSWRIDTEHLFGFVIGTASATSATRNSKLVLLVALASIRDHTLRSRRRSNTNSPIRTSACPKRDLCRSQHFRRYGIDTVSKWRSTAFGGMSDIGRRSSPSGFGLTLNAEPHWGLVDDTSAQWVAGYEVDLPTTSMAT